MKRLGVGLLALMAGSGTVAAAVDVANVGQTCKSVMDVMTVPLASVIEACTYVIEHPTDRASQARALRYRGYAFERQKDLPRALADLNAALQVAPDDHWALQKRAQVAIALGDRERARADYQHLMRLQPLQKTRWRVALDELGAPPRIAPPLPSRPDQEIAQVDLPPPVATKPVLAQNDPLDKSLAPKPTELVPVGPEARQTQPAPDTTALVRELQTTLIALGYEPGPVHGRVDPKTREALDQFAAEAGLEAGREVDQGMLAAAKDSLRQRQGEVSRRQKELNLRAQYSLQNLGYDLGVADGVFGPRSRKALADWLVGQGQGPRESVDEAIVARLEDAESAPEPSVVAAPDRLEEVTLAETPPQPEAGREEEVAAIPAPAPVPAPLPQPEAAAVGPGKRVALVIGNSTYRNVPSLLNPRRDAEDLAAVLREIGFEVLDGFDLDRDALEQRTIEFAEKAEKADLALAYYSGHGMQFDNRNYLVPVDAAVKSLRDVRTLVPLDQLIEDTSQAELAMVLVDACRDNPFKQQLARSLGGARSADLGAGLAKPAVTPPQTLIAYATAGETVAYDGVGENSPYVEALLKHLKTPDLEVRLLFGRVRDDVIRATQNQQWPDTYASLGGEPVYLVRSPPKPTALALDALTQGERRALQRSLKWLGLWEGGVDGEPTEGLREAVRAYQRERGAPDTGLLGPREALQLHREAAPRRPPQPLPPVTVLRLQRRIQAGEPEALRQVGMILDPAFEALPSEPKDAEEAAGYYRDAANKGDTLAATWLGLLLARGSRSAEERAEARSWLQMAAAEGSGTAALRLAELLLAGPDAKLKRAEAVALLQAAAARPDADGGLAAARLREVGVDPAEGKSRT